MKTRIFLSAMMIVLTVNLQAQFMVVPSNNPVQLVNNFILYGVTASNVTYTGDTNTLATFSGGNSTNLGLDNGIAMTTGSFDPAIVPGVGSTSGNFASTSNYFAGDSLLSSLIGSVTTYDASILEFDLVPAGNVLEFDYVFASEEYPEFVNASYNDMFGFFITGPDTASGTYTNRNIAIIPGTALPVCIDNINPGSYSQYYINNLTPSTNTPVYDGLTTVLTATIPVVPSVSYHLKMAIADAGDGIYDSGIFLKAQSMKSYLITSLNDKPAFKATIYPNPLTPNSRLTFALSQPGNVTLKINDQTGRQLSAKTWLQEQTGMCTIELNSLLFEHPAGLYFLSLETPDGRSVSKIVK